MGHSHQRRACNCSGYSGAYQQINLLLTPNGRFCQSRPLFFAVNRKTKELVLRSVIVGKIKSFRPPFSKGGGSPEGSALGRTPQRAEFHLFAPRARTINAKRIAAHFAKQNGGRSICASKREAFNPYTKNKHTKHCCRTIHWMVRQFCVSKNNGRLTPYGKPQAWVFHTFPALFYHKDFALCGVRPRALPSGHPQFFEKN